MSLKLSFARAVGVDMWAAWAMGAATARVAPPPSPAWKSSLEMNGGRGSVGGSVGGRSTPAPPENRTSWEHALEVQLCEGVVGVDVVAHVQQLVTAHVKRLLHHTRAAAAVEPTLGMSLEGGGRGRNRGVVHHARTAAAGEQPPPPVLACAGTGVGLGEEHMA
eukprot:154935-Chlamydomonas_euryale.AAC.2